MRTAFVIKTKKQQKKNKIQKSMGEKLFEVLNVFLLGLIGVLLVYPLYYVIIASFSNANQLIINSGKMLLYPIGLSFDAYKVVLDYPLIWNGYRNTVFVIVFGVTINMILTMMGAYYLSRKGLLFQKFIAKLIMFTMFFGGGLIPLYLTVKALNLLDSLWSLILPSAISTYNMIIMRSAFDAVPESLIEAAEIDGANDFKILWRILAPTCIPTISVLIMYYAVGHWNSWFNAMIFIMDKTKQPLQLVLRKVLLMGSEELNGSVGTDTQMLSETIQYAVIVVSTIPILLIYPFVQKYLVKGVMIGAVKG